MILGRRIFLFNELRFFAEKGADKLKLTQAEGFRIWKNFTLIYLMMQHTLRIAYPPSLKEPKFIITKVLSVSTIIW
jgi:hypothetical protein